MSRWLFSCQVIFPWSSFSSPYFIFLTIYTITVSYIWMVFWLNIAILLIITSLGGAALGVDGLATGQHAGRRSHRRIGCRLRAAHPRPERFITALSEFHEGS